MRVLKIRELPHTIHDDTQLRDATIRTKDTRAAERSSSRAPLAHGWPMDIARRCAGRRRRILHCAHNAEPGFDGMPRAAIAIVG